MASCTCCVCIGGINYTKACSACCGGTCLAMSTSNPNPQVNQSVAGSCGGAGSLSATLNAVGRWGTALTGVLQGKPVATNKNGVSVGAKGSQTLNAASGTSMVVIVLVIAAIIFVIMKKG